MAISAITQIRIALMDTASPTILETATNGLVTYNDLYAQYGSDVEATIRAGAGILGAYYAQQPNSVSSGGESLSWAARVQFYQELAKGEAGRTRGIRGLHVGGAGLTPMFTRASLGTDPTLDEGVADDA